MPPRSEANGSSLPRAQGSTKATAIYPVDSVQDVADSLSLPPLQDSVASVLALDVEYRIRQVIQDASKFMRHGKRSQLRVADIDRALRQRNIEPIFGFHPTTLGKASASGAYPTPVGSSFRRVQTQAGPIHLVADEEIDLEKVLDNSPKVALGPGVGWSAHWLAVEGIQPNIPQNPTSILQSNANMTSLTSTTSESMVQPGGASAFLNTPSIGGVNSGKPGQPVAKPLIKHILSRELQLYFERLTTAIMDPPTNADIVESAKRQGLSGADEEGKKDETNKNGSAGDNDVVMSSASPKDTSNTEAKTTESAVSKSVQESLPQGSGNAVRDAALASLRGDPGLHQLTPYLIQWINEKIQGGLRDEKVLESMLHTIDALLSNTHLDVVLYVHQLLPYVLTILLNASLGSSPGSHKVYILRLFSASILARLIQQYSPSYPTLKPRILRAILHALDAGCQKASRRAMEMQEDVANGEASSSSSQAKGPTESAATKLGAVIGLRCLGAGSLRTLLVIDGQIGEKDDCTLKRLGYWCTEREQSSAQGKEEVKLIVDEIKVSFAEVSSKLRGSVPISHAIENVRQAVMQDRIGSFWVDTLSDDAETARGVLALISELSPRTQEYDENH